jgi:hypothetical protein
VKENEWVASKGRVSISFGESLFISFLRAEIICDCDMIWLLAKFAFDDWDRSRYGSFKVRSFGDG